LAHTFSRNLAEANWMLYPLSLVSYFLSQQPLVSNLQQARDCWGAWVVVRC